MINVNSKKVVSISILNVNNLDDFLYSCIQAKKYLETNININNFFDIAIHFDVMDNKFVNNTGVNLDDMKKVVPFGLYVDTHLMVKSPIEDKYIDNAINYGSDNITIHYEIENFDNVLKYLLDKKEELKKASKKDLQIGVSIKPDTDISKIYNILDKVDKILIMSVEPGYGGQSYIESTNEKIIKLNNYLKENQIFKIIQIDGGINDNTIKVPLKLGVNDIVVGSYITKDIDKYNKEDLTNHIISKIEDLNNL